ncbi:MAG: hypothetical protein ACLPKB_02160 [Xanthobacteraceae bacterium]
MATVTKAFSGSSLDGLDVNLFDWVGLTLSDEQEDLVWAEHNERSLLDLCLSALIEIDQEVDDAGPGLNDTYFSVYARDIEALRQELRSVIIGLVQRKSGRTQEQASTSVADGRSASSHKARRKGGKRPKIKRLMRKKLKTS